MQESLWALKTSLEFCISRTWNNKEFFFKTIKAPCDSNLCENGASCENFDNNTHPYYGCICINGYEGATCQTCKLDNNNLNPRSLNITFSYLINYHWLKPIKAPCDTMPTSCQNGGSCINTYSDPYWSCNCINGFSDPLCDTGKKFNLHSFRIIKDEE